eukprot:TRINITY_DN45389_c0_g2_i1.p2 TRINITY_DN45389_c0_g2~~TRINITY_DN45389_c0_g2_i1.p2  ORF type:complete len:233 (-),score=29.65 TRINITY_DN45389_c0_g2_i1:290-988(-)
MFSMPMAPSSAPARSASAKKRRGEDGEAMGSEDAQLRRLCVLTAKLSLSNAQSSRATKAMLMDVMLMDTKLPLVTAMTAASKSYADQSNKVEPKDRVATLGLVHHHVWNAMLGHIKSVTQNIPELQDALTKYEETVAQLVSKGQTLTDIFLNQVRYVRLAKCFDQNRRRLEVYTVPGTEAHKLWHGLIRGYLAQQKGVSLRPGVAPPGDIELRCQELLEKMGESQPREQKTA